MNDLKSDLAAIIKILVNQKYNFNHELLSVHLNEFSDSHGSKTHPDEERGVMDFFVDKVQG